MIDQKVDDNVPDRRLQDDAHLASSMPVSAAVDLERSWVVRG